MSEILTCRITEVEDGFLAEIIIPGDEKAVQSCVYPTFAEAQRNLVRYVNRMSDGLKRDFPDYFEGIRFTKKGSV